MVILACLVSIESSILVLRAKDMRKQLVVFSLGSNGGYSVAWQIWAAAECSW